MEAAMNDKPNFPEDERLRILRMVEEGKIGASEGVALLEALGKSRAAERPAETQPARPPERVPVIPLGPMRPVTPQIESGQPAGNGNNGKAPRWFRVRVTDLHSGRNKVTVNIPLSLMDWGMRIGAQFAPEVREYNLEEMMRVLREEGNQGKIIDVIDEEDGEHVELYIE
jgi:hypothetical protein